MERIKAGVGGQLMVADRHARSKNGTNHKYVEFSLPPSSLIPFMCINLPLAWAEAMPLGSQAHTWAGCIPALLISLF